MCSKVKGVVEQPVPQPIDSQHNGKNYQAENPCQCYIPKIGQPRGIEKHAKSCCKQAAENHGYQPPCEYCKLARKHLRAI
jgi:hypothetical protein